MGEKYDDHVHRCGDRFDVAVDLLNSYAQGSIGASEDLMWNEQFEPLGISGFVADIKRMLIIAQDLRALHREFPDSPFMQVHGIVAASIFERYEHAVSGFRRVMQHRWRDKRLFIDHEVRADIDMGQAQHLDEWATKYRALPLKRYHLAYDALMDGRSDADISADDVLCVLSAAYNSVIAARKCNRASEAFDILWTRKFDRVVFHAMTLDSTILAQYVQRDVARFKLSLDPEDLDESVMMHIWNCLSADDADHELFDRFDAIVRTVTEKVLGVPLEFDEIEPGSPDALEYDLARSEAQCSVDTPDGWPADIDLTVKGAPLRRELMRPFAAWERVESSPS